VVDHADARADDPGERHLAADQPEPFSIVPNSACCAAVISARLR
jgi:hypothetical protein